MTASRARLSLLLAVVFALVFVSLLSPPASFHGALPAAPAGSTESPESPTASHAPAPLASASTPPALSSPAGGSGPAPATTIGWKNGSFFTDVNVQFFGTGIPLGFQEVPYVNDLPTSTLGFWINLSATAPLVFANLTMWGNQWPGTNASDPIGGFSPTVPALKPMTINSTDPALASYYIDVYRFFWPGATVSFNLTVIGENSTPSLLRSADSVSVPENYPGGYVDNATWVFRVGSPWVSPVFSNDIGVTTTPNVLGPNIFAPNPRQSLSVTLRSIPTGGISSAIPAAALEYTVYLNGTVISYSEPFGPVNHTSMSLLRPIGPYPGAYISFNVTAWLPWLGGQVDVIHSSQWSFNWSTHGGWWHPLSGLLGNVALITNPDLGANAGIIPGNTVTLPTDQPLTLTIREPIQNVTISSAQVVFSFTDGGASHSGTVSMTAVSANTSVATLPGLPAGAKMTFYLVAKDIYGVPVSSGNISYTEAGPTSPALPAGRGLLFVEVRDLSGSGLVAGFSFTVWNGTWSVSGSGNPLGFATPLLPGFTQPVQLAFGAYSVSVRAFNVVETATVLVTETDATPTVVFFGTSQPASVQPSGSLPVDSMVEVGGLVAVAVITLPLVLWFDERRAKAEEEQRRITL